MNWLRRIGPLRIAIEWLEPEPTDPDLDKNLEERTYDDREEYEPCDKCAPWVEGALRACDRMAAQRDAAVNERDALQAQNEALRLRGSA